MKKKESTYIFIDESGKPETYSSNGTNLVLKGVASKYLVLSAVRCEDQLEMQRKVTDFKSGILKDENLTPIFSSAYTLDAFHASNDYQQVKEKFYIFINTLNIKVDAIVVEKLKCFHPLQEDPGKMYGVMAGQLLKTICHQSNTTEIIFSRKDNRLKLRKELEFEVERVRLDYMNKHPNLVSDFKLTYFHNPHYSHGGLQIADYISYAIFQVFERKNMQWYQMIQNKIGRIQDICNKRFFTRDNPIQLSS